MCQLSTPFHTLSVIPRHDVGNLRILLLPQKTYTKSKRKHIFFSKDILFFSVSDNTHV